ncbi:antibacterial protein PR-39-like [Pelobates fuscus]|uniref:antibacterial protein PR-39-like n=1 Tax=Pelobates fuscus TaxID=191477 RepID=UPI002FE4DD76
MGKWWSLKLLISLGWIVYSLAQLQEIHINDDLNIKKAVELFNAEESSQFVFKQISYLSDSYQKVEEDVGVVNFLIKETVCTKSEQYNIAECNFNPLGEIKMCTTYVSEELESNIACTTISEYRRTKRASKKRCNFFCKLKSGATSTIATIKIPKQFFKRK